MTFLLLLPLISSCSMDDDVKTKPCFPFAIYRIESNRKETKKTKDTHTNVVIAVVHDVIMVNSIECDKKKKNERIDLHKFESISINYSLLIDEVLQ